MLRNIIAPAVAGSTIAAVRFAIMSAWNGLLLAEWFGATSGVGWRARYWYDANQLDGFLAWVLLFIAFLIIVNQASGPAGESRNPLAPSLIRHSVNTSERTSPWPPSSSTGSSRLPRQSRQPDPRARRYRPDHLR